MESFNVLISSGGRRISLMHCFREAIANSGHTGRVLTVDNSPTAPAFHLADGAWIVPSCKDESFIDSVLEIAVREKVNLIVPTIDPELILYARNRQRFLQHGIAVSIADEESVRISSDKLLTYTWLHNSGFPTVRTATAQSVLEDPSSWQMPLIVKPRCGSASVGVAIVNSFAELESAAGKRDDLLAQEIAVGDEFTINVYVNSAGRCLSAVPHRRIQTRGGEVAKGITVRNQVLMDLGRAISEKLPGMRGAMNLQCFLAPNGDIKIIELNARFGGGYPLAHQAGAPFTHWLIEESLGRQPQPSFDSWTDHLMMMRFDQEVFFNLSETVPA